MLHFLSLQNKKSCGIIYCRTRDHVEMVANGLTKQGIKTVAYHAGLKDHERKQVQEDWMSGKYPVISATVSFGMGYGLFEYHHRTHCSNDASFSVSTRLPSVSSFTGMCHKIQLLTIKSLVGLVAMVMNRFVEFISAGMKSNRSTIC